MIGADSWNHRSHRSRLHALVCCFYGISEPMGHLDRVSGWGLLGPMSRWPSVEQVVFARPFFPAFKSSWPFSSWIFLKAWQVELAPPLLALQSELRILGDHYASVAPILLKCIEHTGQLSGLWLTPDGMANGKPIKELWANRSISLISQNMCHIRLCLGRTSGLNLASSRWGF